MVIPLTSTTVRGTSATEPPGRTIAVIRSPPATCQTSRARTHGKVRGSRRARGEAELEDGHVDHAGHRERGRSDEERDHVVSHVQRGAERDEGFFHLRVSVHGEARARGQGVIDPYVLPRD